jgi:hypothetical protein
MDGDRWWMRVGDVAIWITVRPSGHARQTEVYTPHSVPSDTSLGHAEPDITWRNPDITPPTP